MWCSTLLLNVSSAAIVSRYLLHVHLCICFSHHSLLPERSLSHSEMLESASVLIRLGADWPVCGLPQPTSSSMLTLSVAASANQQFHAHVVCVVSATGSGCIG